MARKKVNLAWISNDAIRRTTFKKRRHGLIKKVKELSILCGVGACAIIYGPHDAQPEVWPSESEARNMLQRFKGLPEMQQKKKMVNQEEFLQERAKKMVEQLKRMEREIRESEISVLMCEGMVDDRVLLDVGMEDAAALLFLIDMKLKAVYEQMEAANAQMMGAEARTKELFYPNMCPAEIAALNGQMVYGSSNPGLMFELMHPYANAGGRWIHPNFFKF